VKTSNLVCLYCSSYFFMLFINDYLYCMLQFIEIFNRLAAFLGVMNSNSERQY
jgi:hypothetical protein